MSQKKFSEKRYFRLISFSIAFIVLYFGCRSTEPTVQPDVSPDPAPVDSSKVVMKAETHDYPDSLKPDREFRAVWVATVANIDWPSEPGLPVRKQKKEMIDILDRAAALNFNAVIFQVRPAADALYESPYEPWSYYLTGKMGQPPLPSYDPLEFAVHEAHQRGLELHAWFNPYRAGHPADESDISPDHISKTHPEWIHQYGDYLWLDPGLPEVRQYTVDVILDVLKRYDIDGIHFDDYFYPYPSYAGGADFPDSLSWQQAVKKGTTLSRDDWRRQNVDLLVEQLSKEIKEIKPHVKFGISPFGIWRPGYPEHTTGFDAYSELYADARLWLREGWVDYFTPQLYYRIDQTAQPFPVILEWWVEQNIHGRHIWPGIYTGRIRSENAGWPLHEITSQVFTSRGFPDVTGAVHFSMNTFMENPDQFNKIFAAGPHAFQSIVPASPWMSEENPGKPTVSFHDYNSYWSLNLQPEETDDVRWWVIRTKFGNQWEIEYLPGYHREIVYYGGEAMLRPSEIIVSAVNQTGMEGPLSDPISPPDLKTSPANPVALAEQFVKREEWAKYEPLGTTANAVRRNLEKGDTLQFRDLTLIVSEMVQSMPYPEHLLGLPDEPEEEKNEEMTQTVSLRLYRNGVSEKIILKEGEAFNWYGYHIGLVQVHFDSGLAQFEVATVSSLPVDRASEQNVGTAGNRLRVPHTIHNITLHHSGSPEPLMPDDDPVSVLNGLFDWSVSDRNWWDVPYHYLIDLDGNIYEGRNPQFAGETNTTYDPRGHLLISVMGNYDQQEPTDAQVDAIAEMAAYAIQKYDLSTDDLYGHGDWADTTCPGKHLQKLLDNGTILHAVRQILKR